MNLANPRQSILAFVVAVSMAGCSSSDSSGGTGGTGVTTGTVTTYGSIVVNGIRFDETAAAVSINDLDTSGSGDHRGIKIGMTVKIRGSHNGVTGVAYDIEAEHAVEGVVSSKDTDTLVVLGQTVLVDAQTRYEPAGTTFADLVAGTTKVEVYGLRDQNNVIRASLIEIEDDSDFEEELRGVISALDTNAMTFELNGVVVSYDNNTVFDDGGSIAGLADGLTVEVHFDSSNYASNYATEIEFEDNEDSEYRLNEGSSLEIEGYITNIVDATTFEIGSQTVQTTVSTIYDGGAAIDIVIGRKVEVEGTISGGMLVASEIEFE